MYARFTQCHHGRFCKGGHRLHFAAPVTTKLESGISSGLLGKCLSFLTSVLK
jgi:hypothetical protein